MTPKPHERLASAIEARRGELGLSLREVGQMAGITGETLRAVRRGSNEPSSLTKRGIERALQWTHGSVDRILAGGEPTVREQHVPRSAAYETSQPRPAPPARRQEMTDEEIRNSGLRPETVEALLRMRRRVERWTAERDEESIRRADRIQGALEDEDTA